jgi:hypothetical protein
MPFTQGHALLIGVGTYQHRPQMNAPITADDARAVAAVLRDERQCGYPSDQVNVLTDATAGRAQILDALDSLAKLGEDATIFLFYAGHGDYGTDGNYYLTTHDTQKDTSLRVIPGSGVSEQELLIKLRAIKAKRLLLIFNACHSGEISPVLADEAPETGALPPEKTAAALLATGEGRVIITACREGQYSFIGNGSLTLFGQALVDGLQGKGDYLANRGGVISAFDLYSQLYDSLQSWVPQRVSADIRAKYGNAQEPELTILKGVGPFAVALYRGAATLGEFSAPQRPEVESGLREVDPARSERLLKQLAPSGTTVTTVQSGGINMGVNNRFGTVGDIVGGDKVAGDKVAGDKINVGNITGSSGVAIGRGSHASVSTGLSGSDVTQLFQAIYAQIQRRSEDASVSKDEIHEKVEKIEQEANAGAQANEGRLGRWLRELAGMAPDIFDVTVACLTNPLAGFAEVVKKIGAKAKAEQ